MIFLILNRFVVLAQRAKVVIPLSLLQPYLPCDPYGDVVLGPVAPPLVDLKPVGLSGQEEGRAGRRSGLQFRHPGHVGVKRGEDVDLVRPGVVGDQNAHLVLFTPHI